MEFTLTQKRRLAIHTDHQAALSVMVYSSSLVKETSRVIRTLSETRKPPASRGAFQVSPKSSREISVVASKPARVIPKASTVWPPNSDWNSTCLVTPRMVRLPVNVNFSPSKPVAVRDSNFKTGWLATSKKSSPRRWLSRSSLRVLTDAAITSACTTEPSRFSVNSAEPEKSSKFPRTREIPAWRTLNIASECDVSSVHLPGVNVVIIIFLHKSCWGVQSLALWNTTASYNVLQEKIIPDLKYFVHSDTPLPVNTRWLMAQKPRGCRGKSRLLIR